MGFEFKHAPLLFKTRPLLFKTRLFFTFKNTPPPLNTPSLALNTPITTLNTPILPTQQGHASQATLRRRARMKSARRMSEKAKARLALARRGYVPGCAGGAPACSSGASGVATEYRANGVSDCYSDTQLYSDTASINGTFAKRYAISQETR